MIDRLSYFIAKHPKTILLVATILLIPSFFGYIGTFVNYDIMSYLPDTVESVQGEEMLDKEFGLAANAFLVIDDMSAKDVVKIKKEIAAVDGVAAYQHGGAAAQDHQHGRADGFREVFLHEDSPSL